MQASFAWDDVKVFLQLFQEGSFSKAGAALGLHGSTVSRRLDQLEQAAGCSLFERRPEGLVPTEAALAILEPARGMLNYQTMISRQFEGLEKEVSGEVRLALLEALAIHLVAPAADKLLEKYPQLSLRLVPGNAVLDLTRNEADLALRLVRPSHAELVFKRLASTHSGLYISKDKAAKWRDVKTTEELPWCAWDSARGHESASTRWLAQHVPAHQVRLSCDNLEVLLEAVRAGVGAALLPQEVAGLFGDLVLLELEVELPPPIPIYLVCHQARRKLPRVAAVWQFLEELMRDFPQADED